MTDWDAKQYLKFQNERTQPAIDLVNRISIENPRRIIDIGCGPGNSTIILKNRFPNAYILGIDNSENMISNAKRNYFDIDFKICDANTELSQLGNNYDIVFSNACIQWLPNHCKLISEMMNLLKKGGVLAVQTPMNYQEPIHKIIIEVAQSDKWKAYFSNPRIFYNLNQSQYFDLLSDVSADFFIWETTYYHKLESHNAIIEWYRATGLRPYLNVLNSSIEKNEFENDVLCKVIKNYSIQKNGNIIFKFPRFFFIAIK